MNLARVVKVHPERHKVDLLFIADGRRVPGVRVMCDAASSTSGHAGLPAPSSQAMADPYQVAPGGARDVIACVAYYDGMPVVQGFLFPEVAECLFPDLDRVMYRTPSDFYHTVDGKGNAEWFHPSGAFVRIATDPAHEDLRGKDIDKLFNPKRNAEAKVHIHIEQAGGVAAIDIGPDGAIAITSGATLQADIAGAVTVNGGADVTINAKGKATVKAPSILLDTEAARCTGTLTVDKLLTYKGGMAGSGGSGATAKISGSVQVSSGSITVDSGDVTANGISLTGHDHMEQGDGKPVSKPR